MSPSPHLIAIAAVALHLILKIAITCSRISGSLPIVGLCMDRRRIEHSSAFQTQPKNSGRLVATFSANMMHTAPMAHDECPYFRLTGTKGEMIIYGTGLNPNGGGGLKLYNEENIAGVNLFSRDRQGGFFLGFQGVWEVVADILADGDRTRARDTVRNAAADVAVALTLYKSSESGKWEDCEQFLSTDK